MRLKPLFIIPILFVFTISIPGYAQESTVISGFVTTYKNYPLNNVTIKSSITGSVVQSDSIGHFTINSAMKDILIFSASGFDVKKVKIKKLQSLSIDLVYSNKENSFSDALENNHISREDLQKGIETNSLKGVKDYSKYKNIYEIIKNEIINVKVIGTAVLTTKVISFNASPQVLYVVDDMIVTDISYVLPSEVKTIQYLEGVSTSLYGSRGANGVVKITLKK